MGWMFQRAAGAIYEPKANKERYGNKEAPSVRKSQRARHQSPLRAQGVSVRGFPVCVGWCAG